MAPFEAGSVSVGLYSQDLPVHKRVIDLIEQARTAHEVGFDGVSIGEHHAGFPNYLPDPLQVTTWVLDKTEVQWAAPCPILLPLRNPVLVAESIAWLAALHPGRLAAGFAPGAVALDSAVVGTNANDRFKEFSVKLEALSIILRGEAEGALSKDEALRACANNSITILSTAMSVAAVKRAASVGAGIVLGSLASGAACRRLVDEYHDAGGTGPCVLVRRVWIGDLPAAALDDLFAAFHVDPSDKDREPHPGIGEILIDPDINSAIDRTGEVWEASGCTALSIRSHFPNIPSSLYYQQLEQLGAQVGQLKSSYLSP